MARRQAGRRGAAAARHVGCADVADGMRTRSDWSAYRDTAALGETSVNASVRILIGYLASSRLQGLAAKGAGFDPSGAVFGAARLGDRLELATSGNGR